MRIEVEKLNKEGASFAHLYEPEEITLDDEQVRLLESPEIRFHAERNGQNVHLRGTLSAVAEVGCDRCLKQVAVPIETDFDVTYIPLADDDAEDATELNEDDLSASVYDNETIDVDELVREQIFLAMPTRILCRDECKGLCPVCGADKNATSCVCESQTVDPRWAALAKFKSDQE